MPPRSPIRDASFYFFFFFATLRTTSNYVVLQLAAFFLHSTIKLRNSIDDMKKFFFLNGWKSQSNLRYYVLQNIINNRDPYNYVDKIWIYIHSL